MPREAALFDPRYGGGERPSVGSSVSSSACSDGEPWLDDGQWVDGSVVVESAEQLARQVHEAWEYATEVASRPVTAASDLRSPAAAPSVGGGAQPRRRRCSKEAMLSAELAGGATQLAGGGTQLAAPSAAAPGVSPRRLRSAGAAAASGDRSAARLGLGLGLGLGLRLRLGLGLGLGLALTPLTLTVTVILTQGGGRAAIAAGATRLDRGRVPTRVERRQAGDRVGGHAAHPAHTPAGAP